MQSTQKTNTSDKIMLAAIDLMAEHGYHGVTTEEIAEKAGFSEKTLFRHFKSKQNLLESAFNRYHYADEMQRLFETEIEWDLYTDLLKISRSYHHIMYRNRKLIMLTTKISGELLHFHERTHKHPQKLKELLTDYFTQMMHKGKIIQTNCEMIALAFLYMNYGAAKGRMKKDAMLANISFDEFIEEEVLLFTRALKL